MGDSTIRRNNELAGTHGEGFKVASLVMLRNNYKVRYEASSFYWNFQWGGQNSNHLYCKLTPMDEKKLERLKGAYRLKAMKLTPRELKANIWEDVSVKIGRIRGKGDSIGKEDFLKRMKIRLQLISTRLLNQSAPRTEF